MMSNWEKLKLLEMFSMTVVDVLNEGESLEFLHDGDCVYIVSRSMLLPPTDGTVIWPIDLSCKGKTESEALDNTLAYLCRVFEKNATWSSLKLLFAIRGED